MTDNRKIEALRRSTLATLDEVIAAELAFKEKHGFNVSDPDEWQQLKDIVARLELKLAGGGDDHR